ncbi:MAG: hypothetical protein K1X57_12370 [Gemmataceae bacterium]|nr:hypothetical protein [Gemmataceae bacterium]
MSDVLNRIRGLLREAGVTFREVHHAPTLTSEESARERGEPMQLGGKALLIKTDDTFRLFILRADYKFDAAAARRGLGVKKTRFATAEELHALTGLVPGCVPPFGRPILDFDLYVDPAILANDRIAFNAGSLTDSIIMSVEDWKRLANPIELAMAQPNTPAP